MKKVVLGVLAVFMFSGILVSCGGGAMTAEAIQAEAQAKFDAQKADLEVKAAEKCDANMGMYTQQALDSLRNASVNN